MTSEMWVIYDHPKDAPNHYVTRRWTLVDDIAVPAPTAACTDTLGEARAAIPPGLFNIGRSYEIDNKILEVWM